MVNIITGDIDRWEKGENVPFCRVDIPYEVGEKLFKQSIDIVEKEFNISTEELQLGSYDPFFTEKVRRYGGFVDEMLNDEWVVNKVMNDIIVYTGLDAKVIFDKVDEMLRTSKLEVEIKNVSGTGVESDNAMKIGIDTIKCGPGAVILMLVRHMKAHSDERDAIIKKMKELKNEIEATKK